MFCSSKELTSRLEEGERELGDIRTTLNESVAIPTSDVERIRREVDKLETAARHLQEKTQVSVQNLACALIFPCSLRFLSFLYSQSKVRDMESMEELHRSFHECVDDVTAWLDRATEVTSSPVIMRDLTHARAKSSELLSVCEGSDVTATVLEQLDVLVAKMEALGVDEAAQLRERVTSLQETFEMKREEASEQ